MAGLTVIILPVGVNQYMISIRTYKSIYNASIIYSSVVYQTKYNCYYVYYCIL